MARRFGGDYSPNGKPGAGTPPPGRFAGRQVAPSRLRVGLLFAGALPLLVAAVIRMIGGNGLAMLADLLAFALIATGAALTSEGIKAEAAYNARALARPPAMPRKLFGAIAVAAGVGLAAILGWGQGVVTTLAFVGVAFSAHLLAFGMDPLRKKGMTGVNEYVVDRIANAVEHAEKIVREMIDAAARIPDRALESRVDALAVSAREMFRVVENDPRDLSAARKFMTVYLMGARDATIKYADLTRRSADPAARADFERLLADLEHSFEAQREKLLLDNRSDLDVEIEVLRERLQREGVNAR